MMNHGIKKVNHNLAYTFKDCHGPESPNIILMFYPNPIDKELMSL